jgi:hypothetical protein
VSVPVSRVCRWDGEATQSETAGVLGYPESRTAAGGTARAMTRRAALRFMIRVFVCGFIVDRCRAALRGLWVTDRGRCGISAVGRRSRRRGGAQRVRFEQSIGRPAVWMLAFAG